MIRVLIVHETRLMCSVLGAVLREEKDIKIIGYATSVEEAVEKVKGADIALVDNCMADDGAMVVTDALAKASPKTNVLVTGIPEEPEIILRYIEAGASGYVLEQVDLADMLQSIRAVDSGEVFISPEMAAIMISRLNVLSKISNNAESLLEKMKVLTPRESEVLELVSDGLTNREIGENLTIEVGTVKNHIHNILDKLEVGNRHQAAEIFNQQQKSPKNGKKK